MLKNILLLASFCYVLIGCSIHEVDNLDPEVADALLHKEVMKVLELDMKDRREADRFESIISERFVGIETNHLK